VIDLRIAIGSQLSKHSAETTLTLQELITNMQSSGMSKDSIRSVLLEDLSSGGRLFGNYRNQVKNTVKSGVNMAANQSSRTTFEEAGIKEYKWISSGGKSVCPDCERRHGDIGDMDFWTNVGLPQSGFSLCRFACNCQLVPITYKGEDLDKPLLKDPPKKPLVAFRPKRSNVVLRGYSNAYKAMSKYITQVDFKLKGAVDAYVHGSHKLVNPILRGNFAKTSQGANYKKIGSYKSKVIEGKQLIQQLREFGDMAPDYIGTAYRHVGFTTYGSVGLKKGNKIINWFEENQGGVFSNKTFWSTSANSNLEYGGRGNINLDFKIKSKTGTVLNGLNNIKSKYGVSEDEILFNPNTQFKIVKTTKTVDGDGLITMNVDLEEI